MSASIADILDRHRRDTSSAEPLIDLEQPADELPCYAKLRGPRQVAFMVEFRTAAGDAEAFDYGLLGRISFDRSAGITLRFGSGVVAIRGKNLRPLFEGLVGHRVTWVAVAADPAATARDATATVVTEVVTDGGGD